jgi:DNA-binding beta-propeller fold protein YncE
LPLDFVSKDIINSSLLSDTLKEFDHMTETLDKLVSNREYNKKVLQKSATSMIQQISVMKSKLLKHIDELEKKLITKLTSIKEENETKIKKEKDEMSRLVSCLKDEKQELEFHKNHSSNNQLFVVLRKQITNMQKTDTKIQDMMSTIKDVDMKFEENKNFKIETIGCISEITRPCPIQYKSMKIQQTQVQQERTKTLTEFRKDGQVNLNHGEACKLSDMVVISDNKLLICNYYLTYPKVYIYKDYNTYEDEIPFTSVPFGITVVPCTDKAVVTLPWEDSIQFINTTNNTKDTKVKIGDKCYGVTAVKDKIYLGGNNKVIILDINGSRVREVQTDGGYGYGLFYNERNDQMLLRQDGRLGCINLDGHVIYRYDISGYDGLAVDRQGHVYISAYTTNNIHRLSPDGTFRDIVLSARDGIDIPRGIAFNKDFTKLFVICRSGTSVLVYSCK